MDGIIIVLPKAVHLNMLINHSTEFVRMLNWLYCWLESKAEIEIENNISKALVFAYVMHPDQVATLGHANCEKIIKFVREHVMPFEQHFSFFWRIAIRHYDECTNSSIKGGIGGITMNKKIFLLKDCIRHYDECTNSSIEGGFVSMKYSGMPVNLQHSVLWLACKLSLSSEIKSTAREPKNGCEAEITWLWCIHQIGNRGTQLGAGLMVPQRKISKLLFWNWDLACCL